MQTSPIPLMIEHLPWPAALLDHAGVVVATAKGWERFDPSRTFAGLPVGACFFEHCSAVSHVPGEMRQRVEAGIRRVIAGELSELDVPFRVGDEFYRLRAVRIDGPHWHGVILSHVAVGPESEPDLSPNSRARELASANERLREANERLQEANQRLGQAQSVQRAILDSIPDIAWLKDAESRFLAVNRQFGEVSGRDPASLVGKTDYDAWVPELAERYRADDAAVIAARKPKRVEEPLRDKDGQERFIETIKVPILGDDRRVIGTAGIARDVTERRQAEAVLRRSHAELELLVTEHTEALRLANAALLADIEKRRRIEEEQRRFVAILESTTDFVGMLDSEFRIIYVNRAGRRLLAIPDAEDLVGQSVTGWAPPWVVEQFQREVLPTAMREGSWTGESAFTARDGREVPLWQVLLAHRDAAGRLEFVSTIARDMTERHQLEERLLQSQKMEAIGRLAGGIAHDFNNLLTVILGASEAALALPAVQAVARDTLLSIRDAAERATGLTRQLLSFARKQRLVPQVIDLNRQIEAVLGLLHRLISEDIELVTSLSPGLRLVRMDPNQLQQVLVNLAVNARDAMPKGGVLRIETSNAEVHEAVPGELGPGTYARVVVVDSGQGMTPEVLEHVFEPFFTTKGVGEGTGLGLATCYGIVQQAGGSIFVDSAPGKGTTFSIYLPAQPEARTPTEPPRPLADEARGSETILVVEDEQGVRDIVERSLRRAGYEVLVAASGPEAIAIAARHPGTIDLLLTDLVMPQLGGRDVAERVLALRPAIVVLLMSGYADEAPGEERDWPLIAKPFTPGALLAHIRALLQARIARV